MRDTKGDVWEEKSTDKSPNRGDNIYSEKGPVGAAANSAATPRIRKKKAQEAEATNDDEEETVSKKQQRTR